MQRKATAMKIRFSLTLFLFALCAACCLVGCREVEQVKHVHTIVLEMATEPTCDTPGRTEAQKCTSCGEMLVQPIVRPALGHSYTMEWVTDVAPTEQTEGERSRHCTVCGDRSAVSAIPRLIAPTEGLAFELNEEGTGYICIGFTEDNHVAELRVPAEHMGLPVVEIGARAFENDTGITALTVPESIETISKAAFSGCSRLKALQLPDTVKYIADSAFKSTALYADSNLWLDGMLYFGNHLIEVRSSVAKGNFVIREGTRTVSGAAFFNCNGLTSVTVPEGVVSIGNSAFYGCSGLRRVYLPDSLEIIGNGALAYCISLVEFYLPMNVHSILSNPFPGSTALQRIEVDPRNEIFHSVGNCLIETATGTLTIGCVTSKIPGDGSVTKIGTAAFYECGSLITLKIPEGIEEIGISAFHECVNLLEISLPSTLTLIDRQAFRGCKQLTTAHIPSGVETISQSAFAYCYALEYLTLEEGITTIGGSAFRECKALTEVTIPASVTEIGSEAFYYCKNLTKVTLPESDVTIAENAFDGCSNLTLYVAENSPAHEWCVTNQKNFEFCE